MEKTIEQLIYEKSDKFSTKGNMTFLKCCTNLTNFLSSKEWKEIKSTFKNKVKTLYYEKNHLRNYKSKIFSNIHYDNIESKKPDYVHYAPYGTFYDSCFTVLALGKELNYENFLNEGKKSISFILTLLANIENKDIFEKMFKDEKVIQVVIKKWEWLKNKLNEISDIDFNSPKIDFNGIDSVKTNFWKSIFRLNRFDLWSNLPNNFKEIEGYNKILKTNIKIAEIFESKKRLKHLKDAYLDLNFDNENNLNKKSKISLDDFRYYFEWINSNNKKDQIEIIYNGSGKTIIDQFQPDYYKRNFVIDFKTSVKDFESSWLHQLILYAIGLNNIEFFSIKYIGCYNPLRGEFWIVDLNDLLDFNAISDYVRKNKIL